MVVLLLLVLTFLVTAKPTWAFQSEQTTIGRGNGTLQACPIKISESVRAFFDSPVLSIPAAERATSESLKTFAADVVPRRASVFARAKVTSHRPAETLQKVDSP